MVRLNTILLISLFLASVASYMALEVSMISFSLYPSNTQAVFNSH